MSMNPEFRRNLWLELGPQRIIAMPVVLALIFLLIHASITVGIEARTVLSRSAALGFVLIAIVWGSRQASESVPLEVASRTWDWQRMSGLPPWTMTWGKLFGSTIYAWYGGLLCLMVFAATAGDLPPIQRIQYVGLMLFAALLAHGVGLLSGLLLVRSRRDRESAPQRRTPVYVVVVLGMLVLMPVLLERHRHLLQWFGFDARDLYFVLGSVILFAGWAVAGAHRLMRAELQYRNGPWVWMGFVLFLMIYVSGFVPEKVGVRLLLCYMLGLALTLFTAFTDPRDPVALRRLGRTLREGDWARAGELMPQWLLTLLLSGGVGVALLLTPSEGCEGLLCRAGSRTWLLEVLLVLFLLRDLGILWLVSLGGRRRRPELAAAIYLLVLYWIVPGLLSKVGSMVWTAPFWPNAELPAQWALLGACIGPLLVGILLIRRWRLARVAPGP